jgi:hypothetical protein
MESMTFVLGMSRLHGMHLGKDNREVAKEACRGLLEAHFGPGAIARLDVSGAAQARALQVVSVALHVDMCLRPPECAEVLRL